MKKYLPITFCFLLIISFGTFNYFNEQDKIEKIVSLKVKEKLEVKNKPSKEIKKKLSEDEEKKSSKENIQKKSENDKKIQRHFLILKISHILSAIAIIYFAIYAGYEIAKLSGKIKENKWFFIAS